MRRFLLAVTAFSFLTQEARAQFYPQAYGAQISVTGSSVAYALPAGPIVQVCNVGSFPAYVNLGSSGVSATAASNPVQPGACRALSTLNTSYIAVIETAGATTLNIAGGSCGVADCGSGGGGGGGSGGGGAITMSSGAVASGAYSSGAFASGALASGSIATGASPDIGAYGSMTPYQGSGTPSVINLLGGIEKDIRIACTPVHYLSAASTNSTLVNTGAHTLYELTLLQTTTTLMDFRLYDSASAPTCSSATGVVGNYVLQSNAISPGMTINLGPSGKAFTNGLSFCLTGANADTDSTNAVTGANINLCYQ